MSSPSSRQSSPAESGGRSSHEEAAVAREIAEKEELIKKLAAKLDAAQLRRMLESDFPPARTPQAPLELERDMRPLQHCPEHAAIDAEFERLSKALGYPGHAAI